MSNDLRAKWVVFTVLVGLVAFGGWLPWAFFILSAVVTALLFALKG